MKAQVTERNTQIVAAYTAGNTNKMELARYFGVSASTIRRVLAGFVMVSAGTVALSPTIALAELKGEELAAAQAYIAAQPDMPQDLKNAILNGTDLTAVNYQLKNNEYVIQATQEHIKTAPISLEEYRQHQSEKQAAELTAYQHKGDALTADNQQRTAPQSAALSKAQTLAEHTVTEPVEPVIQVTATDLTAIINAGIAKAAQEKGDALTADNQQRTAPQSAALSKAQTLAEHTVTEPVEPVIQVTATDLTAIINSGIAKTAQEKGDALTADNLNRTAPQNAALTKAREAAATTAAETKNSAKPQTYEASDSERLSKMNIAARDAAIKTVQTQNVSIQKQVESDHQTVAKLTATPAPQPVIQQQVRSAYYDKQITALNAEAEQNHAEVLAESHSRAVGDAQTLSQANDYTNKRFSDLKSQVDDNKDQANAGTASALAATGIPQVETGSDFMVGAGAGTYGNQSAIAVGVSGHLTAKTVTKLAVSGDTNNGFGASAGIGWNF